MRRPRGLQDLHRLPSVRAYQRRGGKVLQTIRSDRSTRQRTMGAVTYGFRALLCAVLLAACSSIALAQGHVRVVNDHSVVWRLSSATPLTTVNAGTVLEVVGRDRNWYVVRLPQQQGMPPGQLGRIAVAQVQVVDGQPIPAVSIQQMT